MNGDEQDVFFHVQPENSGANQRALGEIEWPGPLLGSDRLSSVVPIGVRDTAQVVVAKRNR